MKKQQKARIHPNTSDEAMSNYYKFKDTTNQEKIESIIKLLIDSYNAPKDFLSNKTRNMTYVAPRYILFYLSYMNNLCSTGHFEKAGYDHTTFIHGKKRIFEYVYEKQHGKKLCTNPYLCRYDKLLMK